MLSPLQIVVGAALLGSVAFAVPERQMASLPAQDVRSACAEMRAPESYLPPEPWAPACPASAEKKLAAR
jgi:hypothetical protein